MRLKCVLIGLSNSGKTTLFNCLCGYKIKTDNYTAPSQKVNIGYARVSDYRLELLHKHTKTEKITYATFVLIDIPGFFFNSSNLRDVFLNEIKQANVLLHVIRCYDDNVLHIGETIDPLRDKEITDLDLQVIDIEQIEKSILKTEKLLKTGDKSSKSKLEILLKLKENLENCKNIRDTDINEEAKKIVNELFLLTAKPVIYVCNTNENSPHHQNDYVKLFSDSVKYENAAVISIAGAIESEIAIADVQEEKNFYLQQLHLNEPGINNLVRTVYELISVNTFFTYTGNETRAWTIQKGTNARKAAGIIHSDMEKGFIRAEVITFKDFENEKSIQLCKEKGKMHIEGKNYIIQDGDIVYIRFNV